MHGPLTDAAYVPLKTQLELLLNGSK